jgi:putative CRISPR-associated protein (TIGR02619 family)
MMSKRDTLLCTVGTSLFDVNISRLSATTSNAPENWASIKEAYDKKNWDKLADELLKLKPSSRLCGAEINTIEEIRKKKLISLENIVFFVSDTATGRDTGQFLKIYFEKCEDLKLRSVEYQVVERLQDERPADFKTHGLRNLVREMGKYIVKCGGPEHIAIDATGGYKAQIAIAVIVGQSLDVPVFYKHEKFPEIIEFPPLPVSFDYDVLARNSDLLIDFERGEAFSEDELGKLDKRLRVLLSEVDVDGKTMYELSPIGQIYLEGFRIRNPKPVNLIDAGRKKEEPSFPEHHYPKGFKQFVRKVWSETSWIITAKSLSYEGQRRIKGIGFYVEERGDERYLVGTYKEKDFGARFRMWITDESPQALAWASDYLNREYK